MNKSLLYVGLDVHKESIMIAIAEVYGEIPNDRETPPKDVEAVGKGAFAALLPRGRALRLRTLPKNVKSENY